MKTYEEFLYQKQLDESLFSRAVGAVNRVGKGLNKMGSAAGRVAKSVKTNVPKAVNQVKKTTTNVRKEVGKNSRPGRFGAAKVLANRNVRSGLSALGKAASGIRGKTYSGQSLGTAFQSGSGVGSEISQGVKDRAKFERSKTVQYDSPGKNASGQKLAGGSRTVVQRGRQLDKDGNPMDRGKRGKSVLNKVTSKLRRNIGLSDVKDRTQKPPTPGGVKSPNPKGKITGPEQNKEPSFKIKGGEKKEGEAELPKFTNTDNPSYKKPNAGGGSEVDVKREGGKRVITKKYKQPETKQGSKITGGGSRMQGDTTIEKGPDGKMKVTQKVGDDQRIDTQDGIETTGRKTDRKNYPTTKTPFGNRDSSGKRIITGDKDSSPVVTNVDPKPSRSTGPGQAVRKKMTTAQEKSPRRQKRLLDKTPVQSRGGEGATDDPKTSPKITYKTKDKVTTNMTPSGDKPETKKPKSISQKIKDATEKGVNVDDGKGSYTPVINKGKGDDTKKKSNAGRKSGTPTQLSLMKSLNKDSAASNPSERKKQQMQQQQMMNDPRRSGSDDLSDGGNPERGGTKPYKPPSKTESQNIQTKSVINQSRKKNKSGKKYSKGGGAESGGGNQEENRNPVKKKFVNLNKKKNKEEESTTSESFSHWREEFLWEVDKKYPDKVKEIKPMSGKNTITINPEDETSKYKRGY